MCIILRSFLKYRLVSCISAFNTESICFDIFSNLTRYRFVVCYVPPHSENMSEENYVDFLNSIEQLSICDASFVLLGDFNLPSLNWSTTDSNVVNAGDSYSSHFLEFIQKHSLSQLVKTPTRKANTLDLVCCNDGYAVYDLEVTCPFSTSDHNAITFKILYDLPSTPDDTSACRYNFKKANWVGINDSLSATDWNEIFHTCSVEDLWDKFHSYLTALIEKFVPKIDPGQTKQHKYPKHIAKLQSRKYILWKHMQNTNSLATKIRYKEVADNCRKAIHNFVAKKETSIIESNNLGKFYKYANRKLSSKSGIGVLKNNRDEFVFSKIGQADLLNQFFASAFTVDDGNLPPFPPCVEDQHGLAFVPFPVSDVKNKLKKLKIESAGGPDGLPPCFLKQTADNIAGPLAFIFEQFFANAFIPPIWRKAHIRPIFKGGVASDPSNYRPISLTCVCSKVMEAIVHASILQHLLLHDLISKHQHGFLSKRSTCTQLLDSFNDWILQLNSKACVDVIYIDFSRAFDSVVYPKLFVKLRSYGIQYELLAWIVAFLSDRSQCVSIDGVLSGYCGVTSGVPQGSVLAPLLFILYINDLAFLSDNQSVCKLFADDVKLYSSFQCDAQNNPYVSPNPLESALLKLESWALTWQLKVNISKCSVIHFGLHNPSTTYFFNNNPLPKTSIVKDLGITYNNKLCFEDYIGNIVSIAYCRVNLLFRAFATRDIKLLGRAFNTYVRPIVEYCTPLWSPHSIGAIDSIERVQRYFTRRLFPGKSFCYPERLFILNWEPLESRRIRADLTMYYKIINHLVHLETQNFLNFLNIQRPGVILLKL